MTLRINDGRSKRKIDENGYMTIEGCPVSSYGIFQYSAGQLVFRAIRCGLSACIVRSLLLAILSTSNL